MKLRRLFIPAILFASAAISSAQGLELESKIIEQPTSPVKITSYYNFCRIHKTLRCTPAMEAGVTKRLWEIEDIVALLD